MSSEPVKTQTHAKQGKSAVAFLTDFVIGATSATISKTATAPRERILLLLNL